MQTLTSGLSSEGLTDAGLETDGLLVSRPSCHATQARSLAVGSTLVRAGRIPLIATVRNFSASAAGRRLKRVASTSSGMIISGMPPALLAMNGIAAPRHS